MSIVACDPTSPPVPEPHDHAVSFYEHDDELLEAVLAHVAPGFLDGGTVVVVGTAAHRTDLERRLVALGIDVAARQRAGTYCSLDARGLLARFTVAGRPDASAFRAVVGGLVADAALAGGPLRIFGEMVALLWEDGDVDGALALEGFWNDLARDHEFSLFCGYPLQAVRTLAHLAPVATVCRRHSEVVTPLRYATSRADVPAAPGDEVARFFVPVPLAARAARRFVRDTLAAWGGDDVSADAELITSELVGNALVHARSPFWLSLRRAGDGIRLSVQDADATGAPAVSASDDDATGGRGLAIVATLAGRWGVDKAHDGKTVWVELAQPQPA